MMDYTQDLEMKSAHEEKERKVEKTDEANFDNVGHVENYGTT